MATQKNTHNKIEFAGRSPLRLAPPWFSGTPMANEKTGLI